MDFINGLIKKGERGLIENALKELEVMSKAVSKPPYLMQGCGGNVSVKVGKELMIMSELEYHLQKGGRNSGFAIINFRNIRTYYSMVDVKLNIEFDKINKILIRQNTVQQKNYKTVQPSLEAGFHSLLNRYVIHTHSAYANILGWGESGENLMYTIFSDKDINCFWVPCSEPGFYMTYLIKQVLEKNNKNSSRQSSVLFIENHGLVVTADDMQKAIDTSILANEAIKQHFQIQEKDVC